jgi:hypothetical protein
MLQDLEQGVDKADNKLSGAMKKMRKFIRDTEGMCEFEFEPSTACSLLVLPVRYFVNRDEVRVVYRYPHDSPPYSASSGDSGIEGTWRRVFIHRSPKAPGLCDCVE